MESVRLQSQQTKSEPGSTNLHTRPLAVSSRTLSLNDGRSTLRLSHTNSLAVSAAPPEERLPIALEEQQLIDVATNSFCASPGPPDDVPVQRVVQCKSINSSSADPLEQEADRIADKLVAGTSVEIDSLQRASSPALSCDWHVATDRISDFEAGLSGGESLPRDVRARFEPALGMDLGAVRIHKGREAALAAEAMRAHAFATGDHVVFGAGQYAPATQKGLHLLAHEVAHVVQQGAAGTSRVQKHNAADTRLPADQPEALTFAAAANTEIQAALTRLSGDANPRRRNVPAFVTQQSLVLRPLTPRHDSPVGAATINFFPGFLNYTGTVTLPAVTEYVFSPDRLRISIRAREHADIDNLLTSADIDNLVVRAVSEVAELFATSQTAAGLTTFDRYRARFNAMYVDPAFSGLSDNWQRTPTWGSHGPPSARSHAVFQAIYDSSTPFKTAYDSDKDLKELVDTYMGPTALNPSASPGLQRLRAAFFPSPTPVTTAAQHSTLLTAVQAVSPTLSAPDREAVAESNAWQRLINEYEFVAADPALTATRRADILDAIANPPAVPTGPVVTPPAGPGTGGGGSGAACTPQVFVDSVTLDAPASVNAIGATEPIDFTPLATCPNPGVALNSRITVSPPGSVLGNAVDTQPWPNGHADGATFQTDVRVSPGLTIDGQLDLLGGPARTAGPIPVLHIPITDQRESNMATNWQPEVIFSTPQGTQTFSPGDTPRYLSGSQTLRIVGTMPLPPNNNPQLSISVEAEILRGGSIIAGPQSVAWPMGADRTATIALSLTPPSPFPSSGLDALTIQTRLRNAAGAIITGSARTDAIDVGPEATYNQAAAEAAWTADFDFYHNDTPNLVGMMAASTDSREQGFAELVTNGMLTFHPMIVRHDSAAYVTQFNGGTPDPTRHAWLVNTPPYNPMPLPAAMDPTHTHVAPTSWAAMSINFPAIANPFVAVNRTMDVASGSLRSLDWMRRLAVHEAIHKFDFMFNASSPIERYRTEFRAYWTDGRFGPPDQATVPGHPEQSANFNPDDPDLHPPGPQSRRANAIFHLLYDDPVGYPYVRDNYDNNINHFREQVDAYLIPDGSNLILSRRLELLRQVVDGPRPNFATYRDNILAFFGQGPLPAPSAGVLTAAERDYVRSSRNWRDNFFVYITNAADRTALLTAMGIPP
jgi:Domain of unknown function (DUF4157)